MKRIAIVVVSSFIICTAAIMLSLYAVVNSGPIVEYHNNKILFEECVRASECGDKLAYSNAMANLIAATSVSGSKSEGGVLSFTYPTGAAVSIKEICYSKDESQFDLHLRNLADRFTLLHFEYISPQWRYIEYDCKN